LANVLIACIDIAQIGRKYRPRDDRLHSAETVMAANLAVLIAARTTCHHTRGAALWLRTAAS
jgi:hypothetical protein